MMKTKRNVIAAVNSNFCETESFIFGLFSVPVDKRVLNYTV